MVFSDLNLIVNDLAHVSEVLELVRKVDVVVGEPHSVCSALIFGIYDTFYLCCCVLLFG